MVTETTPQSLIEALTAALPAHSAEKVSPTSLRPGFKGKIRYLHTPPKPCHSLFSPPPGHEPEKTRLSSYFLTASVGTTQTPGGSISITPYLEQQQEGVLGIGIEVLIYSTKHLTTLFVSKADTTGYIPNNPASRTKIMCTIFIRWLVEQERRKHPSRKVVVSLFARSQAQYLFPGSAVNSSKHILDDGQLIYWWAKVLDPLIDIHRHGEEQLNATGYLTIPGYDKRELHPYVPRSTLATDSHWMPGHPLLELAAARGIPVIAVKADVARDETASQSTFDHIPVRTLLPRFPDDPKARFIQDLDDEVGLSFETANQSTSISPSKRNSAVRGRWKNIRTVDQFWEAMEFRQECSSGRVVGFLWLVISPKAEVRDAVMANEDGLSQDSPSAPSSTGAALGRDVTPTPSAPSTTSSPRKRKKMPLTGPIVPRQPRLKGGLSSLPATNLSVNGKPDAPSSDSNGLLLTKEGYDKAMHTLLHLDFANLEAAARSTSKWVAEVASICGFSGDWAVEISGTAANKGEPKQTRDVNGSNGASGAEVRDLSATLVKRKRKPAETADTGANAGDATTVEMVARARGNAT